MPLPTPFHNCTAPLCESYEWRNWSGYLAVSVYEPSHEREYYAIRNAAALLDISPLFKYEVSGPDASRLVDRIVTRDVAKCALGQVMYTPWCDEAGKIIDDGTIFRLGENHFRITAADHNLYWFQKCGFGLEATVTDVSADLGALALQGPNARQILKAISREVDLDRLGYFRFATARVDNISLTISRTGYTGDLGYELWVAPEQAERLWAILMDQGWGYGITPTGLVALDMARIEAGLLLLDVDYISAHKALIESQKSSPFEVGLGWTVALAGADFVGRKALLAEKERGSTWGFAGLEVDWPSLEALYGQVDLPPQVTGRASRSAVPVYNKRGRQIGQVTSHTFSPLLKKYIALGTVERQYAALGTEVEMEVTVEYSRQKARATVVKTPFFDPSRKRT